MENKKDLEYHDVQSPEHFEVQTTWIENLLEHAI